MTDTTANNKRIAKNTLILYIRMLFLMAISLYTSRVVLNALGVSDYGIYNVVGGFVALFSILSSSLSGAISRFITFELGKGNKQRLKNIFCTGMNVQIIMALVIIVLAESFGVWFLNYKMNIPYNRIEVANWCMQCSIGTFVVNLITIPYIASIIAHEKMSVFASITIFDAFLKLFVVLSIPYAPFDKLWYYAIMLLGVSVIIGAVYLVYSKTHFEECSYRIFVDKYLLRDMTSFAGWNLFGSGAYLMITQGVNLITNIFFGVRVNAARGVATQAENALMQFVNNFTTALNPQITKSYAKGDKSYMHQLICYGSKYSYFLLFFFAFPICLEAHQVLKIWLKIVPDYAVVFLRFTLVSSLCNALMTTIVTGMLATGTIRRYQIIVGSFAILGFPCSWAAFTFGLGPIAAYVINLFINFCLIFIKLYLIKDLINMKISMYFREVLFKVLVVSAFAIILPCFIYYQQEEGILRLVTVFTISSFSSLFAIYFWGINQTERSYLLRTIKNKLFIHG